MYSSDTGMLISRSQPLLLDPTVTDLTSTQQSLITSALPSAYTGDLPPSAKLSSLPPSAREGAAIWANANNIPYSPTVAESFILLSNSQLPSSHAGPSNWQTPGPSHENLAQNLHEILSSQTPVDHPLCVECTGLLQSELQKQLEELTREREAYLAFERGILRNREDLRSGRRRKKSLVSEDDEPDRLGESDIEGTEEEWAELIARKKELEKEEKELIKVLAEKEKALEAVRAQERKVQQEELEMDRLEEEFLLEHFNRGAILTRSKNALQSAKTQLLLSQNLLRHLESTNVWNDAFHIGNTPLVATEGKASGGGSTGMTVGTINGLRLGGRPVVEWDEINAAWGLVALCVDRIAAKIGCIFEQYVVVSPLATILTDGLKVQDRSSRLVLADRRACSGQESIRAVCSWGFEYTS